MRLKDKVIIVTGSTTGIGEAMARRFVAEGAKVLIHGLEADLGTKVAADLAPSAALHLDDLSAPDAPARVAAAAEKAFGRIDCIVNNAAWIIRSNIQTTDVALFDRVMAVNVRAPLMLIRAAMPRLKESQGSVLSIGSINGYCGESNQLAYSISKGALMTLTRNLSDAHGRDKVRFNQINLGWVLSENEYKLKSARGCRPIGPSIRRWRLRRQGKDHESGGSPRQRRSIGWGTKAGPSPAALSTLSSIRSSGAIR